MATFTQAFTVNSFASTTSWVFQDTSNYAGTYGGNPLNYSAVDTATLTITDPGGTAYTINLLTNINAGTFTYTITMGDMGGTSGDTIIDGVYDFSYHIVENGVSYDSTNSDSYFQTANIDCDISSKAIDITDSDSCCDDCGSKAMNLIGRILIYYEGMWANYNCGNLVRASEILDYITDLLETTDCGCS